MRGAEYIWILGDEFAYTSFQRYYKDNKYEGKPMTYLFEQFEVREFLSTKYSTNPNVLARMCNNLLYAMNEYKEVPKLIVVILDLTFSEV